jgi:alkanesulfonate monooxygenase SsuD/methylene tetrahydromethanopterin reductase-like flavin-dependent oxidoreductase (luciferase family)
LGPVITYLFPQYRAISLLAKQVVTLQDVSNGRLELRTGAGATLQYATQWWYPYGIDYPKEDERVSIFEEGIQILQKLLGNNKSTPAPLYFNGKYFKINGAILKRPTKSIPITIAAKRKRMVQIAAKYADIWESSYITPEEFSSLNTKFENVLIGLDRDNKEKNKIIKSIELDVMIAESDSDLEYKKRIFAMERGPGVYSQILKHGLVGNQDTIAKRVKEYKDAVVDQFFLAFHNPFDSEALEMFMNEVKE